MARIKEWMDLAELGDVASLVAAGWALPNGAGPTTSPHFTDILGNGGRYSLVIAQNWTVQTPLLATPIAEFYTRFHFLVDSFIASAPLSFFRWMRGGTVMGTLAYNSVGNLLLYSGDYQTFLGQSTNAIATNTWYTIELHIVIGDAGTYELRVNGSSVGWIPAASGDTKPGSDTGADSLMYWAQHWTNFGGYTTYMDDAASDTAQYPGEAVITTLSPNGPGATTQLTPTGSPNNWQNVDEIPPSDTDYNEATSANLKDTYTHTALPATAGPVRAALVAARVVKAGSTINNAYLVVRSGTTDFESSAKLLPPSPSIITNLWETDPNDGAWTPSSLNASQIGIRFDA